MKHCVVSFNVAVALTALLIGPTVSGGTSAHARDHAGHRDGGKTQAKQTVGSDYLVQVGKHVMWKSQVEKMHPEMNKAMVPIAKSKDNDFLVTVGKQSVWASTLRRDPKDTKTYPAKHGGGCQDYLVQAGKKPVRASTCSVGGSGKDAKPLCCAVPMGDMAKMPPCCQHTQKK